MKNRLTVTAGILGILSAAAISLAAEKRLSQSDLEYLGAFRVPQGDYGSPQYSGFNYGGTALTYNPNRNSLFLVGMPWYQLTAEISIPQPVISTDIGRLNTATVLQPFADVTEGNRSNLGAGGTTVETSGTPLGGFLVWGDKLVGTAYGYYDAGWTVVLSHFTSGLNLSASGDFRGMYQVGDTSAVPNPAFIDGYMTEIPAQWRSRFGGPALTGNCCISIISRTSSGPAASVFDPDKLGVETPVPIAPAVGYPIDHATLGSWGDPGTDILYNGSMAIHGMVFPSGSRSVLFFGRRGKGEFCYGFGVSDPSQHGTYCNPSYPTVMCCYDPVNDAKGTHSYPYVFLVVAYDALDLLSVVNGQKQMWDIVPYAAWELTFPVANDNPDILGAAYDPSTQRIYVAEAGGDRPDAYAYMPLIHVYHVNVDLPPTVASVTPSRGPQAGGTRVSISGTGFVAGATVSIGGTAASDVAVVNSTSISATTPPHSAGTVSVDILNPDGQMGSLAAGYTYEGGGGGGGGGADLSASVHGDPDPSSVGGCLTYTIGVGNAGPDAATSVLLTDVLPSSLQLSSASTSRGSFTLAGNTFSWDIGSLTTGGSATANVAVRPLAAGTTGNSVSVTGEQNDPNADNNSATASVTVGGGLVDSVDLTAAWGKLKKSGRKITGRLRVRNSGNVGAGRFTVKYYDSPDATPSSDDKYLTSSTLTQLGPGATSKNLVVRCRASKKNAGHYLIASVDPDNQVVEGCETNNHAAVLLPK
ncbi:MAG: IPT/TIG domain-containing protein [Acidobacteria bacterium]|nr:IPT/TIG domain-containing protein [Acidobacteriota bacterium]